MRDLAEVADDELLRLAAHGDEEAFTVLYRRRQPGIFRFALQMTGSRHVAEEVTQEVFMAVIRQARAYDAGRGPVSAWFYGIARHHVLRCLGRERALVPIEDDAAGEQDASMEMSREQEIESLRRAVLALPPEYREIIVLCELQEMSYADAAAAVGCAIGTVRSRLHRARELLARKLRASERCSQ